MGDADADAVTRGRAHVPPCSPRWLFPRLALGPRFRRLSIPGAEMRCLLRAEEELRLDRQEPGLLTVLETFR